MKITTTTLKMFLIFPSIAIITKTKPRSIRPSCISPNTRYREPQETQRINIGYFTTLRAMVKKFLGLEEGSLLCPSTRNFSFAWTPVNPLNLRVKSPDLMLIFCGSIYSWLLNIHLIKEL